MTVAFGGQQLKTDWKMNENTGHHSNDQKAMKIAKHDEHKKKNPKRGG